VNGGKKRLTERHTVSITFWPDFCVGKEYFFIGRDHVKDAADRYWLPVL
jgi:hypothetical protein